MLIITVHTAAHRLTYQVSSLPIMDSVHQDQVSWPVLTASCCAFARSSGKCLNTKLNKHFRSFQTVNNCFPECCHLTRNVSSVTIQWKIVNVNTRSSTVRCASGVNRKHMSRYVWRAGYHWGTDRNASKPSSIRKCPVVRFAISIPKGLISSTAVSQYTCSLLNVLRPKTAGDWLSVLTGKTQGCHELTLLQRGASMKVTGVIGVNV